MIKATISASNRVDGKNVEAGQRVIDKPETLDEAVEAYGSDLVLKCFWKSHVIDVQAQIRSGSESPTTQKVFKSLSASKQEELLKMAKELGILS